LAESGLIVGSLLRILLGYVVACLAAGATQTLFVVTPSELAADMDRISGAAVLMAMAATQTAVFAIPFAGIAIVLTEWFAARVWLTYAALGVCIAMTAYFVAIAGESGAATILNDYAFKAFLAAGLVGGMVYWLVAGRRAGAWHRTGRRVASETGHE